jgi:hypothetical protein
VEADISVKMQAMLAYVMVVPTDGEDETMTKMQGFLGLSGAIPADSDETDTDEEE